MVTLDPRRILIFRAVARAGSVSAAARELGWTQPAVTQHLNALERSVGCALLLRGPAGVSLTEPGRVLLERADAVAAQLDLAHAELADLSGGRPVMCGSRRTPPLRPDWSPGPSVGCAIVHPA